MKLLCDSGAFLVMNLCVLLFDIAINDTQCEQRRKVSLITFHPHALFRRLLTSTDLFEFTSAWAGVSVFDIRCSCELSTADMDIAIIIQPHLGEHFTPTSRAF